MVLEVGRRGAAAFRIIRKARTIITLMVLEVGGKGGGWFQNHKKSIGLL